MKIEPAKWPEQLRVHWTGRIGRVTVLGRQFPFLIISHDLHPAPKWFVGYKPAMSPAFISDQVPRSYRPFMIAHEIFEVWMLADQPNRCRRALEFELSRVPPSKFLDYLRFRVQTWDALMAFVTDPEHGQGYAPEQVTLMKEAQRYLKQLL